MYMFIYVVCQVKKTTIYWYLAIWFNNEI